MRRTPSELDEERGRRQKYYDRLVVRHPHDETEGAEVPRP